MAGKRLSAVLSTTAEQLKTRKLTVNHFASGSNGHISQIKIMIQ
jgi:hypothetical protein